MTDTVSTYDKIGELRTVIASVASTGAKSPEEALDALNRLDRLGVESFLTEEADLWIRYWTIAAKDFVPPEHAAVIRSKRPIPEHGDELDWLSKNFQNIQIQYGGQWVAIYGNEIVATASNLPGLMSQINELDRPFITFIPLEPIVWTFTYAH